MNSLRPEQIMKILELTDSFNISRESVTVPLATAKEGKVEMLPDGRLRIIVPEAVSFEEWLSIARESLKKMDLSAIGG